MVWADNMSFRRWAGSPKLGEGFIMKDELSKKRGSLSGAALDQQRVERLDSSNARFIAAYAALFHSNVILTSAQKESEKAQLEWKESIDEREVLFNEIAGITIELPSANQPDKGCNAAMGAKTSFHVSIFSGCSTRY